MTMRLSSKFLYKKKKKEMVLRDRKRAKGHAGVYGWGWGSIASSQDRSSKGSH